MHKPMMPPRNMLSFQLESIGQLSVHPQKCQYIHPPANPRTPKAK